MSTTSIYPTSPQSGGKRKLSKWNKFTSKVYATEHRKNKNFKFKDALKMASAMKKKGQYGGEGEEDSAEDIAPPSQEFEGGRRRRRTMRRSRGRSRGRGRARASRRR